MSLKDPSSPPTSSPTTAQTTVAWLIAHGYSNRACAQTLDRSEKTIEKHLTSLYKHGWSRETLQHLKRGFHV